MTRAIALIDCNNFYASCEKVFDPSLKNKPLVVLSNNDGCIISRNAEARSLNIKMGAPYYKVAHTLKSHGVQIRSSNYELYGDMSKRLMELLKGHCEELDIYSIDEAFCKITRPSHSQLTPWAYQLRSLIYQNLGLSIAIGIGSSKGQAKASNYLAKSVITNASVFDITTVDNPDEWLEMIEIENVWGIGHKLAYWCRLHGIKTARQLRDMPSNFLKRQSGIKGLRIQHELRGESCSRFTIENDKKETCVSRSFNKPITDESELRQAIASYVVRASEKLRIQNQLAGAISIFIKTSSYKSNYYSKTATKTLDIPTNNTNILLSSSLSLTKQIFQEGYPFIKAGVIMQKLQKPNFLQQHLFQETNNLSKQKQEKLMDVIDNLNKRYGKNTITWCACGIKQNWQMKRERLSKAATTRLNEIPILKA